MAGTERKGESGKREMRLGTEGKPTAPFPLSLFSSLCPFQSLPHGLDDALKK